MTAIRGTRTLLLALVLGMTSCGTDASVPAGTSAPTSTASSSASAVATASPSPTPSPTPMPTPTGELPILPPHVADFGSYATTLVDGLRVRYAGGIGATIQRVLPVGERVFIVSGPIEHEGYDWYEVVFRTASEVPDEIAYGWLAGAEIVPESELSWLIEIDAPRCPDSEDASVLGRLTPWAIGACEIAVTEVTGIVDICIEGPLTPYTYEPLWAWFSCPFLRSEESSAWWLNFYPLPNADLPELERGDVVRLQGRIGFDESVHGACDVDGFEPELPVAFERKRWQLYCQTRFMVSSGTIEGHVDLPSPY